MTMRYLLTVFLMLLALTTSARNAVVTTEHVRAELLVHAPQGLKAGAPVWLGLSIKHIPGWHTYWRNPGDSGLPIALSWTLPQGMQAGEIQWPVAKAFPIGPMTNYGYDGEVLLPVPVTLAVTPGDVVDIQLHAEWLVCEKICIPEDGDFTLTIPTGPVVQHQARFEESLARVPQMANGVQARASFVPPFSMKLVVDGLPESFRSGPVRMMAEDPGVIEHAGKPQLSVRPNGLELLVPVSPQRSASPERMHAVLVDEDNHAAIRIAFPVEGGWNPASTPAPAAPEKTGLLLSLEFAFLGGALLNLMPCVFPVLSLKVLGFAQHAADRKRVVQGGFAYSAGVVLSFLALAAVLLLLRAGGAQLGWGFQLQSPYVIAALAALFTLIGLNLAGAFEFGSMLPSSIASLRASKPAADDFLSGVLAVAVASPCTAPFMGAAVGAAIFLSATESLLIFATIGAGMAAPYLAASLSPRFAAILPRPGTWMVRFKQVMAIPMFLTVAWLLWVLGQQLGAISTKPGDGQWQAWSTQAVAQAREQGRPVFVDFTAAWCITCQVNKRLVLNDADIANTFAGKHVLTLRADWTGRDPAISAELTKLGRNGVPVYALYSPGSATPVLLPELLSVTEVKQAVAALPGP
jgi:thiol:disulfide interchange protein DsbD